MASSLYSNSQHVDFDSVLAMDDQGMVSMFQGLMASGLAGFLGCPAVIYEDALVDFFENASVREVNAKVDIMASRLNDVQKNVEETKEALSRQLLEFESQAQENQNILHAQLSELVNYINRGGADKKGESSSRGPQQPSHVQIRDSGTGGGSVVRTPDFAQRVEIAQRRIVENVLDADRNAKSLERQAAAERDRERRRREARMLKRRRKF
ncbi:hypothetical protein F511_36970 [Dorcoceras hygrometricum]|uniref:Uncharacterized protein n=1 Tax=Dorcoceras hygrometricum TaxID=472368 RepID=A0A2Z7B9F7_9LAMI|nr:hypothetical protein F511_36970 [Dorcoceras hygrometricum]